MSSPPHKFTAENDDDMKMVFALLMETGYRKPVIHLTLDDKRAALLDYHCMLKVKASMDQYAEGLEQLNVLQLMQKFPKPFLFLMACM